jgi:polysaccharide biosynthesis/export protein
MTLPFRSRPMRFRSRLLPIVLLLAGAAALPHASSPAPQASLPQAPQGAGNPADGGLALGPDDQIAIRILEAPEIVERPVRVDTNGFIELPLVGRLKAGGLTVAELHDVLVSKYKTFILEPEITVAVEEFRSQPVSVIGAVNSPGVQQVRGRKTLVEMLSLAGGVRPDAGYSVKITRRLESGPLDLPTATVDPSGQFSVAEVSLKSIIEARDPDANITVKPHDVISVPRAQMVYVVGEVEKAGGFVMSERESLSVLQALSLAGGLRPTAVPKSARILRATDGSAVRQETPVNLAKLLAGSAGDIPLRPDDILFIPGSTARRAGIRALETAISLGTGIIIWRR